MKTSLPVFGLLACLILGPIALNAQTTARSTPIVATAAAIDGTVFVTREGGRQALLTRGSSLQQGDAINTTRNSTVRLRFTDGSETVIRPESTLLVQNYQFKAEAPAEDNILLSLIKGGMRALSGAIGKRGDINAYKLHVSTATIGIRGTDYSVRLCQNDCNEVANPLDHGNATPVAARAVQVHGAATVSHNGGPLLPLTENQPLYSSDIVETKVGAYAVLVFRDNARVTVNAASRLAIAEYRYEANSSKPSMLLDLLKGGLRIATGLIGKMNPTQVKVRSATATIGIRGTVFDLVCAAGSSSDSANSAELGDMPCEESLFAQTREGTITLTGNQGETLMLPAGQSGRVDGPNVAARALAAPPAYFQTLTSPAPESIPANLEQLFGAPTPADLTDGILLTVNEGRVVLAQSQKDITLDRGESLYAPRAEAPIRLFSPPAPLDRDPFLSKPMFNTNMCRR